MAKAQVWEVRLEEWINPKISKTLNFELWTHGPYYTCRKFSSVSFTQQSCHFESSYDRQTITLQNDNFILSLDVVLLLNLTYSKLLPEVIFSRAVAWRPISHHKDVVCGTMFYNQMSLSKPLESHFPLIKLALRRNSKCDVFVDLTQVSTWRLNAKFMQKEEKDRPGEERTRPSGS